MLRYCNRNRTHRCAVTVVYGKELVGGALYRDGVVGYVQRAGTHLDTRRSGYGSVARNGEYADLGIEYARACFFAVCKAAGHAFNGKNAVRYGDVRAVLRAVAEHRKRIISMHVAAGYGDFGIILFGSAGYRGLVIRAADAYTCEICVYVNVCENGLRALFHPDCHVAVYLYVFYPNVLCTVGYCKRTIGVAVGHAYHCGRLARGGAVRNGDVACLYDNAVSPAACGSYVVAVEVERERLTDINVFLYVRKQFYRCAFGSCIDSLLQGGVGVRAYACHEFALDGDVCLPLFIPRSNKSVFKVRRSGHGAEFAAAYGNFAYRLRTAHLCDHRLAMEAAAGDRKLALVHGVVQVAVEHYSIVAVYLEGAARYGGFVPVEYRRLFNVAERTCRNCEHAVVVILYGIEAAGVFASDYVHYRSRARRILAAVVPAVFNERRICAVLRNIAVEHCGAVVEQHIIAVAAVIRTRRTVFKASCKPCTVEDEHAAHFVIYGSPCVRDIIHNAGLLFGAVLYGKVAIVDYGMVAYVGYREACKVERHHSAFGYYNVFKEVVVEFNFNFALGCLKSGCYRGITLAVYRYGNLIHAFGSFVCGCDCVAALAVGIERRARAEVVYIDGYRKFAAADGIMHVCRAVVCNYRAAELAALYNGRTVIEARAVVRGDYRIRGFAVRVERAARYGEFVPVEHGGLRGVQKFAAVYLCNAVVIVL